MIAQKFGRTYPGSFSASTSACESRFTPGWIFAIPMRRSERRVAFAIACAAGRIAVGRART